MNLIEEYLQTEYIVEKNRIHEVDTFISEVIATFKFCNSSNGWPYEIAKSSKINDIKNFSFATNSMILFLLGKFLEKIDFSSPIIPGINWEYSDILKTEVSLLEPVFLNIKPTLINNCNLLNNKNKNLIVHSKTFGNNDPFTMSWMSELLFDYDRANKTIIDQFIPNFINASIKIIENAFKNPDKSILVMPNKKMRASDHIFPLLRVIHLYSNLTKEKFGQLYPSEIAKKSNDFNKITELVNKYLFLNLTNRINQQLSYSISQKDLFDTAELVLSIEALILIDHDRRIDENLLNKAFKILKNNQQRNQYWRPLKPFVTSPQGHVLLPLSIEIANSLIRTCKHLETSNYHFFNDFFEIFERYAKWLFSNVTSCTPSGIDTKNLKGWHSENVQKQNVIHPWETAQVIIYLMNYKTLLQEQISYKSFKMANFSFENEQNNNKEKKISLDYWEKNWQINEPLMGADLDKYNCYREIGNDYIKARVDDNIFKKYSMLIYGPPGTGKTSLASHLAHSLNWKLITITPSDFLNYGESGIEERAKCIFKTLEEQKDCVVLFDEIDRLILDRTSKSYIDQSDMFQFMTPSMLVKIKDLRSKKKIIFIIATNFEERIDAAIKRLGRIDAKYLICPPNKMQRLSIIKRLLIEFKFPDLKTYDVNLLVNETALFTYGELKLLLKTAKDKLAPDAIATTCVDILMSVLKDQDEPTINLSSYSARLPKKDKEENDFGFPFEEFFLLVFILCEVEHAFTEYEKFIIKSSIQLLTKFRLEIGKVIKDTLILKMINDNCLSKI